MKENNGLKICKYGNKNLLLYQNIQLNKYKL